MYPFQLGFILLRKCAQALFAAVALVGIGAASAHADTGKLLLTGGISNIEGAAGGGLSPWAVIGSNATDGEVGGSAYLTRAVTQDYELTGYGAAMGFHNRFELSLARQNFNAAPAVALNGIAPFGVTQDQQIRMDVLGLKLKVAGDAVLNSDSPMPQVAVGLLYKRVFPGSIGSVLRFLGTRTDGIDLYISATKLLLAQSLLVSGALRSTKANQNGLLGFGSGAPGRNSRGLQPEFSVALMLGKNIAVGAEYRFKPNNLEARGAAAGLGTALREQDWKDVFVVWAPGKNLSLTLAWVDLGKVIPGITGNRGQTGYYLSGQFAF